MNRKRSKIKWLLLVETIVLYFSILNIVSHARGPVPYQMESNQPILEICDFAAMTTAEPEVVQSGMRFYNTTDGVVTGYRATLELNEVDCLNIQFQINCPAAFAGNTLIIDLYNYEFGYDNPEQECHVVLQKGINNISIELVPGEGAPKQGELRLFTVNTADYQAENLMIYEKIALPKISFPMIVVVLVMAIVLLGTLIYDSWLQRRK